jgi:hypothetical protein
MTDVVQKADFVRDTHRVLLASIAAWIYGIVDKCPKMIHVSIHHSWDASAESQLTKWGIQ